MFLRQYSQWEDLERCHHSLSLIYQKHADITNSLSHASKSLEIAKKLNDHKLQYEVLFLMGQLLLQQGNYSEAKRMLRKVRRLINSAGTEDKEIIKLLKVGKFNCDHVKVQ